MNCEELLVLWSNIELRQKIVDKCRQKTDNRERQAEYLKEVWLTLGTYEADKTDEQYTAIIERVIFDDFWKKNKEKLLNRPKTIDTHDIIKLGGIDDTD